MRMTKVPPKERTYRSRKYVLTMEMIGVAAFILGFVFLLIPAILSDAQGHYESGCIMKIFSVQTRPLETRKLCATSSVVMPPTST